MSSFAVQGRGQAGSPSGGGSAAAKKRKAVQADEPLTIPETPCTAPGVHSPSYMSARSALRCASGHVSPCAGMYLLVHAYARACVQCEHACTAH